MSVGFYRNRDTKATVSLTKHSGAVCPGPTLNQRQQAHQGRLPGKGRLFLFVIAKGGSPKQSRAALWLEIATHLAHVRNNNTTVYSPIMAMVQGANSSQHPVVDIALPSGVASRGDHAAVGLKPHRVCHACSDLDDARPAADIALTGVVPSRGDDGAVGLKPHRELAASGDLDDVGPAADIALSIVVPSHGDHSAVGLKPHRVMTACSDLDDARPASDIALPSPVSSHRDHGAV